MTAPGVVLTGIAAFLVAINVPELRRLAGRCWARARQTDAAKEGR